MTTSMQTEISALLASLGAAATRRRSASATARYLSGAARRGRAARRRLDGSDRVAVWAMPSWRRARRGRRADGGRAGGPDQPQVGRARARAHRRRQRAEPGARRSRAPSCRRRWRHSSASMSSSSARDQPLPGRTRSRVAGADRLHVGHDRAAQGRGDAAPGDRLEPGRARRGAGSGPPTTCSPTGCRCFTSTGSCSACSARCGCGGTVHHLGSFSTDGGGRGARRRRCDDAVRRADDVPPACRRRRARRERWPTRSERARLLVSGSAALSTPTTSGSSGASGQRVVERYGMTETLMNCAVRADGDRRPGTVGPPVDGVELRLVDEDGAVVEASDGETVGRDPGSRPEPVPRVPQPARRHRGGVQRRLVSHRRRRHA